MRFKSFFSNFILITILLFSLNCYHKPQKNILDLTRDVQLHKDKIDWYYTYILTKNENDNINYFIIIFQYYDVKTFFSNLYIKDILKDTFYFYETDIPIYFGMKNLNKNKKFQDLNFYIDLSNKDIKCSINFIYDDRLLINGENGYVVIGDIKDTAGYFSLVSNKLSGFIKSDKVDIDFSKTSRIYGWFDHQWGNMKLDSKNRWVWSGVFLNDDEFLVSGHFKNMDFNFLNYHDTKKKISKLYKNTTLDPITFRKSTLSKEIYEHGFKIRSDDDSIYLFYEPLYEECFIPEVIFTGPCKVKGFIYDKYYEGIGTFEISDPVDSNLFYPFDFYKNIFNNSKKEIEKIIEKRKGQINK